MPSNIAFCLCTHQSKVREPCFIEAGMPCSFPSQLMVYLGCWPTVCITDAALHRSYVVSCGLQDSGSPRQTCTALGSHAGPAECHRNVLPPSPAAAVQCSGNICVLKTGPGLCGFPWEILVCPAMVVFIVKSQHTLRMEEEEDLAKVLSAPVRVYWRASG